ncbi:hypothetical protein [Microbacterium alcoholitolerans]|uniref:hypothetical protein n=1 Tax=unclassified Microbacterium TaxID=2609290 RepID=UPI003D17209B
MEVEALAVSKIQSMVARCPHLKPIIASNDKTPFTDGHIDVYSGIGRKNDDWRGRVSVQVKGRTRTGKLKEQLTFGIDPVALRGFQKDSGVLYFYVAVDRQGHCSPYYALLSPFTIEHYLRNAPEGQKVSVAFKKFRNDPSEIERIVGLALKTKEQRTSMGFDPVLLEKMQSLTVHSTTDLDLTSPVLLMPGEIDFALEVTTEGGMSLPLGGAVRIVPQEYIEHEAKFVLGGGPVVYDDVTVRRLDERSVEVRLDEGLLLVFTSTEKQQQVTINFTAPSNFAKRLRATEFLAEVVARGELEVNGSVASLGSTADGSWDAELKDQRAFLRELQEVFNRLAVDANLVEFDELGDEQVLNLQNLHRAFIRGEEPYNEDGELARGLMDVGPWLLMILVTPGSAPNRWRYVDPFDPAAPHMLRWSADEEFERDAIPVTAYDVVEQDELPRILNLRLDSIVSAYEAIADAERTLSLANQRVLGLILAADACKQREEEFLRAAETLNEWVISIEGEKAVHLINRWQILWRRGSLTNEQRESIRAMKRKMTRSADVMAQEAELACALLSGDDGEVDFLVDQMTDDQIRTVHTWPIWRLRVEATATPIA